MRRPPFALVAAFLLLALGGGLAGYWEIRQQRTQLATRQAEQARLAAEVRRHRQHLQETQRAQAAVDHEVAATRAHLAALEASPAKLWSSRVILLRQLLSELPGQSLPELKLLEPVDWIEIARSNELDTASKIRAALAALRAVARHKFAKSLQAAAHRFADQADGELPTDIRELAPFLVAPADPEMLARYSLARTGKLAASDGVLFTENPTSDMILSVRPDSWNISNNAKYEPPPGESELDVLDRAADAIAAALSAATGEDSMKVFPSQMMHGLKEMVEAMGPQMEATFGDSFGPDLKTAAKQFLETHPDEALSNLAQLAPFLKDAEKLAAAMQPALAQLKYRVDHNFQAPTDDADLQRYIVKSFNLQEAMRLLKVTFDGESITVGFSFETK